MSRIEKRLLTLLAAGAVAACSSPDVCTRGVNAIHKVENEIIACMPDAGLPADTESASEIAKCQQQLPNCTASDRQTFDNSVTCAENLPAVDCAWFAPSSTGFNPGLALFALDALQCYPQGLSASCSVPALPLDAGFGL